ncbi:hypothetical protein M513_10530, partial [Trichuris suis]
HGGRSGDNIRCKVLVTGSSQVGKTAIIKRFICNTFSECYRETVEDIFSREFIIRGQSLVVDIYDSHISYPDMRRLRMATADAIVFVFALEDTDSFEQIKLLMIEAAERRKDINEIPCVLVGNKSDKPKHHVSRSAVNKWLSQSLIPHYVPYLETSAKSGENILEIFHSLLRLCLTMSPKQKIFTNSPLHQASRNSADEECRDHKKGMLLQRPSSIRRPRTSSNLDNRAEQITSMMRNFSITRHASLRLSKRSRTENNGKEIDQSECQIS